jgi:hypothetical protein
MRIQKDFALARGAVSPRRATRIIVDAKKLSAVGDLSYQYSDCDLTADYRLMTA